MIINVAYDVFLKVIVLMSEHFFSLKSVPTFLFSLFYPLPSLYRYHCRTLYPFGLLLSPPYPKLSPSPTLSPLSDPNSHLPVGYHLLLPYSSLPPLPLPYPCPSTTPLPPPYHCAYLSHTLASRSIYALTPPYILPFSYPYPSSPTKQ